MNFIKFTFVIVFISLFTGNIYSQVLFNGNNVGSTVSPSGVFNKNTTTPTLPGMEWPIGTGKYSVFSSGLNILAKVNGDIRMAASSYKGEFIPGYSDNGTAFTNSNFRIYKVKRGDNAGNNPDYAQWGLMVPYGAPYVDVNNNGIFELGLDTPGVKGAEQTLFLCMTDGFTSSHITNEGFGGGTAPLFTEVHMTAWCYSDSLLQNIQFIKWDIVNKSGGSWNEVYLSLFFDGDLGLKSDDYIGCDSILNMGFTYNSTNNDGSGTGVTYGANPPAVGISFLRTPKNPAGEEYGLTSFALYNAGSLCEGTAITSQEAYNYASGFKIDGSKWMNPEIFRSTKYCFPGDPLTNTGWTESDGRMMNCNGDTTGTIVPGLAADRKCLLNTGDASLSISNNNSVQFVIAQHMNRGMNNFASVTALKNENIVINNFWNTIGVETISTNIPERFFLHQNYPNPFNPATSIRFDVPKQGFVSLKVFDISGREVAELVKEELQSGVYEYSFNGTGLGSGVYFYKLESNNFTETKRMVLVK